MPISVLAIELAVEGREIKLSTSHALSRPLACPGKGACLVAWNWPISSVVIGFCRSGEFLMSSGREIILLFGVARASFNDLRLPINVDEREPDRE